MTTKKAFDTELIHSRVGYDDRTYIQGVIEAGYGQDDPDKIINLFCYAVRLKSRKITEYLTSVADRNITSIAFTYACKDSPHPCFDIMVDAADHDYKDSLALQHITLTYSEAKIRKLILTSDTQAAIARLIHSGHPTHARDISTYLDDMICRGTKTLTRQEKITQLIINNDSDAIKKLIENGEDMTFGNHRPIRMATLLNRTDIAKALLSCSTPDDECMQVAIREEKTPLVELFLSHMKPDDDTMIAFTEFACDTQNRELVKTVVSHLSPYAVEETLERFLIHDNPDNTAILQSVLQESALKNKFGIDGRQSKRNTGL